MKIILASQSIDKLNILKKMNLNPEVIPANIDEKEYLSESADNLALRLSFEKANKIAQFYEGYIIGADTVAVCNNEILPKTTSNSLVKQCLQKCSNQIRTEITGICIIKKNLTKILIEKK